MEAVAATEGSAFHAFQDDPDLKADEAMAQAAAGSESEAISNPHHPHFFAPPGAPGASKEAAQRDMVIGEMRRLTPRWHDSTFRGRDRKSVG